MFASHPKAAAGKPPMAFGVCEVPQELILGSQPVLGS